MLSLIEILLPLIFVILILIPLINVFRGKVSRKSAKTRLITHVCLFFAILTGFVLLQMISGAHFLQVFAADGTTAADAAISNATGLGYIGAGVATGLSSIGAGIAVAAAAPAAIGALSENEKNFGKSLIFVALGEGVAIYGLLISILIITSL